MKPKFEPMSEEEVRALPVSVPLDTAGRAFGFGRTKSHELTRAGEFPCRVLRFGRQYVVLKADLLTALKADLLTAPGFDPASPVIPPASGSAA